MVSRSELTEFVDYPKETLSVEYKTWLDLGDVEVRANLARHIAALANHGGGALVFGFDDEDLSPSQPNQFPKLALSHDLVSSISKKYLEPAIHCDVETIRSALGNTHSVVVVPSHGNTPICAKANGPEREGKVRGIVAGTYYARKPGPESAGITKASEWTPIIRRCAMHDRTAILAALGALTSQPTSAVDPVDSLDLWHSACRAEFERELRDSSADPFISHNNVHLSYGIDREDGQLLHPKDLLEIARQINSETKALVNTGWSMFYPFSRKPIAPFMNVDPSTGMGDSHEFLEASLLRNDGEITNNADVWRICGAGRATIIRPFRSDFRPRVPEGTVERRWLSPNDIVREIAELMRHATAFSERFDAPVAFSFIGEWRGLKGRSLSDPDAYWSPGRIAGTDSRVVRQSYSLAELVQDWPSAVSKFAEPLIRVFDPTLNLSAADIARLSNSWRPMGGA